MADFFDLPRAVRDKIYRLHLLSEKPLTLDDHLQMIKGRIGSKSMPPIMRLSKQAEKETASIYYGENHFDIGNIDTFFHFSSTIWPRHLRLVSTLTFAWAAGRTQWSITRHYGNGGMTREHFIRISNMRGLKNLNIRVDEEEMIQHMSISRETRQRPLRSEDMTPQEHLAIFRFPAITGLLHITNVKNVRFIKVVNEKGEESGGPLPDGPLLTKVLPRLRPKVKARRKRKGTFPFLDLPPELRNRVYDHLLQIPGPVHPSAKAPTTAPKDRDDVKINETADHESALSLLAVNKQIHDEAVGIFYTNPLVFYYPTQLHAFLQSIGSERQRFIKDLTIYYYNMKCGGINVVDLTFTMLKQLTGLRRLHILMITSLGETGLRSGWLKMHSWRNRTICIVDSNPVEIPGMKTLFELRGLTDVKVRDLEMEKKIVELDEDSPDVSALSSASKQNIRQLARAHEHFNKALADAQVGKVNHKLFENTLWHLDDEFPMLDEEPEEEAREEHDDDDDDEEGFAMEDSDFDAEA